MQVAKTKNSQFGDMALESTQTGFIQKLLTECRQKVMGAMTVLCSWARHFTLTVPPSTQEYKWVPANCWGNLACKQALRMGYSEICFRIARGRARRRACNGPCTI